MAYSIVVYKSKSFMKRRTVIPDKSYYLYEQYKKQVIFRDFFNNLQVSFTIVSRTNLVKE